MTAGHIVSLRQRDRDILIRYNDGTYLTSVQPAEDLERMAAQVNGTAAMRARQSAEMAEKFAKRIGGPGPEKDARMAREMADGIDLAPMVEPLPAMRMAAE